MSVFSLSQTPEKEPPDDTSVLIHGKRYRIGALLHQGHDSRFYAASLAEGGEGSAFVMKYFLCIRGDDTWDIAMREIEAGQMLRRCRHAVRLLGYAVRRVANSENCEVFLLMKWLPGCIKRLGSEAEERQVLELCRDIRSALRFLRHKGLVHGDVKPANIYYDESDGWQLGDFGSVIRTGERPRDVSEGYCSPEARRGEPCDYHSDLYSLGVVAYRLLSGGRLPFCNRPCEQMTDDEVYHAIGRRLRGDHIPPLDGVSERTNRLLANWLRQSW